MTKKEIMKIITNEKHSNNCEYLYRRVRKEGFEKALEIYNTVSHTKGYEFISKILGMKEYRY